MGAGAEADPSTCCRWTQQAWGVWDAGSARAAGFAEGTGREAPPGRCFPPALSGLSRPWITPTGRHLHGADKVPAAKAQREEGLWRGGCSSTATGRRPWRLAAQIGLQPPTRLPAEACAHPGVLAAGPDSGQTSACPCQPLLGVSGVLPPGGGAPGSRYWPSSGLGWAPHNGRVAQTCDSHQDLSASSPLLSTLN